MTPPFQDERHKRPLQRLIGRPFLAAALSLGLLTFLLVATNVWLAWRAHADAWSVALSEEEILSHWRNDTQVQAICLLLLITVRAIWKLCFP